MDGAPGLNKVVGDRDRPCSGGEGKGNDTDPHDVDVARVEAAPSQKPQRRRRLDRTHGTV
ncbi:MAG TPA: hypothetical protein VI687_00860 [Candidatus Limnocylindrales bacterium]|nr:hypothetical protein [Candidatus Limnocylindrales bacterium]